MDSYERFVLRRYAANIFVPNRRAPRLSQGMARWLSTSARLIGLGRRLELELGPVFDDDEWVSAEVLAMLSPILRELRRPMPEPAPSPLQHRPNWLAEALRLERQDAEIVGAAVRFLGWRPFGALSEAANSESANQGLVAAGVIARALRRPEAAVGARTQRCMPLRLMGLIEPYTHRGDSLRVSGPILRIARLRSAAPESLQRLLLGRPKEASLDWVDFDHLGASRDLAQRLVAAALGGRTKGVNLLLHGVPGTGKTEFARSLARQLDAHAVFVGETDDDENEPTRSERVSSFLLARAVAGRTGRRILVMDEADDVFLGVDDSGAEGRRGSKVFMNRLVETTQMPVIWITNAPDRLGAAVLRRMDLAIAFPEPGRALRARMLTRALDRRRMRLGPAETERLAALEAPPAVLDRALRVAKLVKGKGPEATLAAGSIVTLLRSRPPVPAAASPIRFDPALSAADTDLTALAEQVAQSCPTTGRLDLSFCLHGLPGTGKSAYARHLACCLGLDVLEKRASDLIGPYVGQTEAQIAAAFREAADKRAMLVLDEADSFLRDRAGALRSWEVSQVNEMLTWMERHPYPFVCTTNLMDSFDPATLRRFVFKVRFLPMSAAQAAEAFQAAFGMAALDPLTPGDFAVVARKAAVLGERDAARLVDFLRAEVEAKPGATTRRIGFGTG